MPIIETQRQSTKSSDGARLICEQLMRHGIRETGMVSDSTARQSNLGRGGDVLTHMLTNSLIIQFIP